MKKLILTSLLGLQSCTQVQSFFYWFEHSENMRMPKVETTDQETQYYEEFKSLVEDESLPW